MDKEIQKINLKRNKKIKSNKIKNCRSFKENLLLESLPELIDIPVYKSRIKKCLCKVTYSKYRCGIPVVIKDPKCNKNCKKYNSAYDEYFDYWFYHEVNYDDEGDFLCKHCDCNHI